MAVSKAIVSKTPLSKKEIREQIVQKIEKALADLKSELGEKNFKRRIKKAGKLISSGLPKAKPIVNKTVSPPVTNSIVKKARTVAKKATSKILPAKKAAPASVKK